MSYVSYMSYLSYMSYVCRLYELYELCKLYGLFYESLKIVWNHLNLFSKIFQNIFVNIYRCKIQVIKTKILRENT